MTKAADLSKTGSLVNSSGQLDLTTGVTGILPVANGGTGSSSGVSPGGSTTQVQYNNAGAFGGSASFVFDGTNVGIGTASPSQLLDIVGTTPLINIQGGTTTNARGLQFKYGGSQVTGSLINYGATGETALSSGTTGSSGYFLTIKTDGSERLRVTETGNVGIGTSSPSQKLQVQLSNATAYSSGVTGNGLYIYNSSATTGQYAGITLVGEPTTGNGGIATIMGTTTGSGNMDLTFSTRGSATLAERMRITSAGNVGIGTSSPNINGWNTAVTVNSVAGGYAATEWSANGVLQAYAYSLGGSIFGVGSKANIPFALSTNDTERMRITAAGGISFGSSGTAYGSSGQVLTSNGDAAPTWGSVSGTAKAWVNFNGSGGGIRASSNVSSISVNGTGRYTVNMSTAQTDANYARIITASGLSGDGNGICSNTDVVSGNSVTATTTAFGILLTISGQSGYRDSPYVSAAVFR